MIYREIIRELEEEHTKYEKILRDAEKRLKNAPEGTIHVNKHGRGHQCYFRANPQEKNGVYLPASQQKKIAALIQKNYDQKVVRAAGRQRSLLKRFLKTYDPNCLKTIYKSLSDYRRKIILPAEISDEEYADLWQSEEFEPKPISKDVPEHFTNKGERVRSKSEVMIADALNKMGIPYKYERPLYLKEGSVKVYPDFTILKTEDRTEIFWEHLGRMDDPGYFNKKLMKIRSYEKNGIMPGVNLILTMETAEFPMNFPVIRQMIQTYCL